MDSELDARVQDSGLEMPAFFQCQELCHSMGVIASAEGRQNPAEPAKEGPAGRPRVAGREGHFRDRNTSQ